MNRYFQTPPVVKNLIIINVLVYMATALLPVGDRIMEYCALSLGTPFFHTYQFITYMFLHANFEHIFFNMFALWMFGRTLEYELGSQRMLLIPPIPMKAKWFVIIYAVIELFLGWRGVGNVAHFAHVGGMLWGFLLLQWWKRRGTIRF